MHELERARTEYAESLKGLEVPPNPAPYLRYIEGVLQTFGEETDELVTYDSFIEDMVRQGLDERYADYAWVTLKKRPYQILVRWL